MTDLSSKTFFVVDDGLFADVAERLARDAGRVLYFCPWMSAFPTPALSDIGTGLKGVERVKYFWDAVQEFDPADDAVAFVFPSVGQGDLQMELARRGFPVWGSRKGEELELFRADAKRIHQEVGLAVNRYETIVGVPQLREYLEQHPNVFVKVSEYRGIGESFHARTYAQVEARLDKMQSELGPLRKHTQPFIVEGSIPTEIELGGDGYTVNGQFPAVRSAFGIEIKDLCFGITHVAPAELPKAIRETYAKMAPVLKAYNYCGPFHTENRISKDGTNYVIDYTCRGGSPPTEIMLEWFANFSEIVWEGAHGRLTEFTPTHRYGFQIGLYSEEAMDNEMIVQFPDAVARFVKLYYHARAKDGTHHVIHTPKSDRHFGNVIGLGNTIQEGVEAMFNHAEKVEADGLHIDRAAIGKLYDELRAMADKGMAFGPSPIPESV